MDSLQSLLTQFGCSIAANYVYDWIKNRLNQTPQLDGDVLRVELARMLSCKNSEILVGKIVDLLIEEQKLKVSEVGGRIIVSARNAKDVIGLDIRRPARILPGTEINVSADNSDSVTGVRVG